MMLAMVWAAPSCQPPTAPDVDSIDIPVEPPPASSAFRVVGYHPYWSGDEWRRYDFSLLDAVYFFSLDAGSDGSITETHGWPNDWSELRATAAAAGVPVVPTVAILAADTFRAVFSSQQASDRLVETLVALALEPGTGGLHLDFEMFDPVDADVRNRVTYVVRSVRERIRGMKPDFTLSAFALANDPAEVFDEAGMASWVDYLVVQGYDFHWIGGDVAGPVAPLEGWNGQNWHGVTDRYLAAGIPKEKILFTVPYYGYEWPAESEEPGARTTGRGIEITYAPVRSDLPSARDRAAEFGKRRDPGSGSPYYVTRDSTGWRQGWFEDAESLSRKYDFVRERGLRGIAVFPMAYGDEQLDASLVQPRAAMVGR